MGTPDGPYLEDPPTSNQLWGWDKPRGNETILQVDSEVDALIILGNGYWFYGVSSVFMGFTKMGGQDLQGTTYFGHFWSFLVHV